MPSNNIFDDIGNAIGGVFGSIGQAIDSGAKGLTRGMQPEQQAAPRHVAPRKRATAASLKPAQAKVSAPDKAHKVGEWYMDNGMLTMRLRSLNPFKPTKDDVKPKNDPTATAGKAAPKHHAVAQTGDPKHKSRVAARKPGSLRPET
jgi:hypothetical protein